MEEETDEKSHQDDDITNERVEENQNENYEDVHVPAEEEQSPSEKEAGIELSNYEDEEGEEGDISTEENKIAGNEIKEMIELNLDVAGQMGDEFGKETSDRETFKDTDNDEDDTEQEASLNKGKSESSQHSTTDISLPGSSKDVKNEGYYQSREIEGGSNHGIKEEYSVNRDKMEIISDLGTEDRKDQETQSTPFDGFKELSLSGELAGKDSMIDALFNKSPVSHDHPETSEVQVTVFLPNNQSITKYYLANTNVNELKKDIGEIIDESPDKLLLSLMGNSAGDYIGDWTPLLGIPPNSVGGLILNLSFKFDIQVKNVVDLPRVETYAPIITVRQIKTKDALGRSKLVTVVTEDISYVKEWLGGFKNIKTGQTYHNAWTETRFWDRKFKTEISAVFNSRDVQTHLPYLTKYSQVDANKATQMWRSDHYIQSVGDKVITARPYIEFDLQNEQQDRLKSAIKIQRWYRRNVSKRNVRKAFTMIMDLLKQQREKRNADKEASSIERIKHLLNIGFPSSRKNFYSLYAVIWSWWKKEYNKISQIKSISERKAACNDLLQNEIDLLFVLEKQKIKNKKEALQRRDMKIVVESSRPIIRHQRKGNMTIVDTLEVQRARELKEVFMTYIRNDLKKEERIQVLTSVLNTVQSFDEIDYSKDLIMLLRREIDMISIGIDESFLHGLRKRVEEGLLHFIRDHKFNPQAKHCRPIHFSRVNKRSYRCKMCGKLKTPSDFPMHVRLRTYHECTSCNWLKVTSYSVLNISPYASILTLLRANEVTKCPRSTYCLLLQPFGTYFIVNTIWNGKSAISDSMHLPSLRLCRWDNKLEWSPWNAILLTALEAEVHERILNVEDVYEQEFIQSVKLKHLYTRYEFKVMDESEIHCRETGLWDTALDENIYQHMNHRREALQFIDPTFKLPPKKAYVSSKDFEPIPPCNQI